MSEFSRIADDVKLAEGVQIHGQVNLYGCTIGKDTGIGAFVEIGRGVVVGRRVKISAHAFLCNGVTIEDDVFIGPGVRFTNDKYPSSRGEWKLVPTLVCKGASIGANATIVCGVVIGAGALVGAGAVVTRDVPPRAVVVGNPARPIEQTGVATIPFMDLKVQYRSLRGEIAEAMQDVLDNTAYVRGPAVSAFEREFAFYIGTSRCVALGSGTAALQLALRAMGVGPGDEVITHTNTFIATVGAIALTGARPVFVDIERDGLCPSAAAFLGAVTDKTKVIIPVHLSGFPFNGIEELVELTARRGVSVLEDACQAHGARIGGRAVGTFGRAAAFSFYPSKNLGAYGDAGAVVTDDETLAETIVALRHHGSDTAGNYKIVGSNERMDTLQAAVLRVKLPHLNTWNAERRAIGHFYTAGLSDLDGISLIQEGPEETPCYYLYTVRHYRPDDLVSHLRREGIQARRHCPIPCHLTPAYSDLGFGEGSLPNAEKACATSVSLPIYPGMPRAFQERVVNAVRSFCECSQPESQATSKTVL